MFDLKDDIRWAYENEGKDKVEKWTPIKEILNDKDFQFEFMTDEYDKFGRIIRIHISFTEYNDTIEDRISKFNKWVEDISNRLVDEDSNITTDGIIYKIRYTGRGRYTFDDVSVTKKIKASDVVKKIVALKEKIKRTEESK